ncbi:hypothetical protein, partial [Mycolicibacterium brumae]
YQSMAKNNNKQKPPNTLLSSQTTGCPSVPGSSSLTGVPAELALFGTQTFCLSPSPGQPDQLKPERIWKSS